MSPEGIEIVQRSRLREISGSMEFAETKEVSRRSPRELKKSYSWETSSVSKEVVYLRQHFTQTESHEANTTVESPGKWTSTTLVVETSESIEPNDTDLELNAIGYTFSKIF